MRHPVNMIDLQNSERVAFSDATALARVTALLVAHHQPYHIRFQVSSKLDDLRDGPAVLIGGFNNSFTLRLTGQLRFGFLRNTETMVNRIQDRNDPQNPKWSDAMGAAYTDFKQDYAIVSRVMDPTTGRVVVTASGSGKVWDRSRRRVPDQPFLYGRDRQSRAERLGPEKHPNRHWNGCDRTQRRPSAHPGDSLLVEIRPKSRIDTGSTSFHHHLYRSRNTGTSRFLRIATVLTL